MRHHSNSIVANGNRSGILVGEIDQESECRAVVEEGSVFEERTHRLGYMVDAHAARQGKVWATVDKQVAED